MKEKILNILRENMDDDGNLPHALFDLVADEILSKVCRKGKTDEQKKKENDYLEIFNRIKKSFCEKRNMKFTPTRVVSKPSQLHARLKDYTMDEIGKVIYGAFSDNFHIESKWKWVTTSYVTRCETIEKYLA